MKCPYCKNEASWVSNERVYGKRYGKSYMCYYCSRCDAYVGCANNSRKALGTMANKELREWRRNAHQAIDPVWKSKRFTRSQVYAALQRHFGKTVHIGEADLKLCKDIVKAVPELFPDGSGQQQLL